MNDYLIDKDTLGQFVDALIAQKYQNQPKPENIDFLREDSTKKLDNQISRAIFGSLSEEKLDEINLLFDREEQDPAVFQDFFDNSGIDLQKIVNNCLEEYKNDFLNDGGNNV